MTHLPEREYAAIQRSMPIACVDVLVRRDGAVGLILRRSTASDDLVWGLVGGRVLFGETLEAALTRQLTETLGDGVRFDVPAVDRPALVAEYFPDPPAGKLLDPRQHSIAATYMVEIHGDVEPRGEAADFRWFAPDDPPAAEQMVPGHDAVVRRLA